MTVFQAFVATYRRDLGVALAERADLALVLAFFVLVVGLFPLALGADSRLLQRVAPGVFWVAALLAALLSLPRMFAADFADGTLEQLALAPAPLTVIAAGKIAAHWSVSGLPLALVAPLLGLQFNIGGTESMVLVASLLIGTPVLSLIGGVCSALTLSARGGGTLLALLTLPLFIPVLIFGAGAVAAVQSGLSADANLSLLGAALLVALVTCPFGAAAAVNIALD